MHSIFCDVHLKRSNDGLPNAYPLIIRLVHWADLWQLQISITKCNSMHIGRQPPFYVDLKIRDLSLPVINSCRDLGILVCSSLSHSSHIANIINVASQRSNLILRTFVTRDIATLKSAFVTYVRPLLEIIVLFGLHSISPI